MGVRARTIIIAAAMAAALIVLGFIFLRPQVMAPARPEEVTMRREVPAGVTFAALMAQMGVATDTSMAIFEAAKPAYDLSKIVSGRALALVYSTAAGWPLKALAY